LLFRPALSTAAVAVQSQGFGGEASVVEMDKTLTGKVAVVTGASRGIGRIIAQMLADRGASLVLMARSTEEKPGRLPGTIEHTADECRERGAEVVIVPGDVAREEDVTACEQATRERFGRCDLLVNNAAVSAIGSVETLPLRLWQRSFEVNVHGPYMMIRHFLPLLRRSAPSHVINVSSGAARMAWVDHAAYSASKAALDRLSLTAAEELKPDRITVVDLQLELAVLTEGFVLNSPGVDTSNWEKPKIMGEAVLWIVAHGDRYNGRVLNIADLRKDYAAVPA
jgi:citronellol/citronellal dehydrogenase